MTDILAAPQAARIARGGKAIYGVPLGILMLEARFPRIPGDMGNGTTWPFPVLYRVVGGASPEKVVLKGAAGLLPDFIAVSYTHLDVYKRQERSGATSSDRTRAGSVPSAGLCEAAGGVH